MSEVTVIDGIYYWDKAERSMESQWPITPLTWLSLARPE